jgi:hypothetical protein
MALAEAAARPTPTPHVDASVEAHEQAERAAAWRAARHYRGRVRRPLHNGTDDEAIGDTAEGRVRERER